MTDQEFKAFGDKCNINKKRLEKILEETGGVSFAEAVEHFSMELEWSREFERRLIRMVENEVKFSNWIFFLLILISVLTFVVGHNIGKSQEIYNHPYRQLPAQKAVDLEQLILEEISRENRRQP